MSVGIYMALLAAVGVFRMVELQISRRHQRRLAGKGIARAPEPHFPWMVLLHGGVLAGAALEVLLLRRSFHPGLAVAMGALFLLANLLRGWVIVTLGEQWNAQVMNSVRLGVVTRGPYRWIRHPNYLAVFVELIALPLIYSAWFTALVGAVAHVWVLGRRIAVEEKVLLADRNYRALMGSKPRFLPGIF